MEDESSSSSYPLISIWLLWLDMFHSYQSRSKCSKKGSIHLIIVFLWAIVDSNFWICKSLNSNFETIAYEPGPIHHIALPSHAMAYPIQHKQLNGTLSLSTAPPIWQTPHSIDDSSNSSTMWHERCDLYPDLQSSVAQVYSKRIYYLQSSACS